MERNWIAIKYAGIFLFLSDCWEKSLNDGFSVLRESEMMEKREDR